MKQGLMEHIANNVMILMFTISGKNLDSVLATLRKERPLAITAPQGQFSKSNRVPIATGIIISTKKKLTYLMLT